MDCYLCNKQAKTFLDKKTNITYYHCMTCEFIYKSPKLHQSLSKQKIRYNLHDNKEDDVGYIAYYQRFLDFTLSHVKNSKKALDFGCGATSLLANMLEEKGIACDYYDPIYYPDTFESNKKYDLILSTEVFEHLHEPKLVFKSLIERLEKRGYLAIQTQFHPNNSEAFKTWYYHHDPTHIIFFTQRSFKILATMYDCVVIASNNKNMILIQKRD